MDSAAGRRGVTAGPRILLLGASGQLGQVLGRALPALGSVTACDRRSLDLEHPEALAALFERLQPQIVVNAAAWTAVDAAEAQPQRAWAINAAAPALLAQQCQRQGALLLHYSTDYVFDGRQDRPYAEQDPTQPLSEYGRSKLAGEQAVLSGCDRSLVLRISWLYSAHGHNFLRTVLRLAQQSAPLRVVSDQLGTPTPATLVAEASVQVLRSLQAAPAADARWGLYHLTAAGHTSWHGFAQHIVAEALAQGWPLRHGPDDVQPQRSAERATAAVRPACSRLATQKLTQTFGIALPHWQDGVRDVIAALGPPTP